eukprot:138438-Pleurochrysis_carterae.AAC.2
MACITAICLICAAVRIAANAIWLIATAYLFHHTRYETWYRYVTKQKVQWRSCAVRRVLRPFSATLIACSSVHRVVLRTASDGLRSLHTVQTFRISYQVEHARVQNRLSSQACAHGNVQ